VFGAGICAGRGAAFPRRDIAAGRARSRIRQARSEFVIKKTKMFLTRLAKGLLSANGHYAHI
jgi:hypothetical protein